MSYCVHCGVELDRTAGRCPLCFTPVMNPIEAVDETSPTPFPTRRTEVAPVSKRELALLLSIMLASAAVGCFLLNIFLQPGRMWSMYVVGAMIMLWVWLVLPLQWRRIPIWVKLTTDVIAVGIYVYLISIDLNGSDWFWGLAMPIILTAAALVLVLSLLLRVKRRSILTSIVFVILAAGAFMLLVELFVDRYLDAPYHPGWSIVAATVCVAVSIPLVIVRRVPSLRQEARRRFHL